MTRTRAHVGRLLLPLALLACVRYEMVNELDYPGACPPKPPVADGAVAETTLVASNLANDDTSRALVGVITDRRTGTPISDGVLYVLRADTARVPVDSAGRFRVRAVAPRSTVGLDVRRVGYARLAATVRAPDSGRALRVALTPQILDGPCSGFAAYRLRKPWWKLW